jgi:hypothetical protein
MEEAKAPRYMLFRALIVIGAGLGVLLLVQSVRTYRFVAQRLVEDDLWRQAARHAASLARQAFRADARAPENLAQLIDEVREEERNLAWVRVLGANGEVLVESGEAVGDPMPVERVGISADPTARVFEERATRSGKVLVALFPFRPRFRLRRPEGALGADAPPPIEPPVRPPRYAAIEIAVPFEAAGPSFSQLRRNLVVSVSAAIALLGSMAVLGLRLNHYVRGKHIEQQVALARRVQQDLLPAGCPDCGDLDFSAVCEPAWQVGGDFYDIFPADSGRIAVILGDVSGKGVPAALLMFLLHGAVRSSAVAGEGRTLDGACRRLNQLLCSRTAVERFASLFWCYYDPAAGRLHYVNAGHLPPILARGDGAGRVNLERLETGGPVLGVIPDARYREGESVFRPGDTLVIFSDGLVEAMNGDGEEFGEARLEELVREHWRRPATEIRDFIQQRVREFIGRRPLDDDLTLLVVKVAPPAPPSRNA